MDITLCWGWCSGCKTELWGEAGRNARLFLFVVASESLGGWGYEWWDAERKLTLRREGEQAGRGTNGMAGNREIPFVRGRACRTGIRMVGREKEADPS